MKFTKPFAAALLSLSATFAAHAETPDDSQVLVRVKYEVCIAQDEIAPSLKHTFNQDKVDIPGKFLGQNATLYANTEEDSYTITVDVPTAQIVGFEGDGETAACVLQRKNSGYATAAQTDAYYRSIFSPQ